MLSLQSFPRRLWWRRLPECTRRQKLLAHFELLICNRFVLLLETLMGRPSRHHAEQPTEQPTEPEQGPRAIRRRLGMSCRLRARGDAVTEPAVTFAGFPAHAARPSPADPGGIPAAPTRTLPRDVAAFTGRQQERHELVRVATRQYPWRGGNHSCDRRDGRVGRTAFAVHAAHRLADRSPMGRFSFP